ncbi:hypothetical protein [Flavobacterium sp. NKUCC04_CG]|uniref:hypothetical protein n=1 Tax=Flavobacterium sp. NKUCC04_CG TaxID=2842121 RepID=UPI001C5BE4FF|nr:hypothetical protein [Flavobacterium sp. NKUCC04_CG]MBW3517900.1 hypothetical protein [Flavobacterium sp. NKUCC04_CG]
MSNNILFVFEGATAEVQIIENLKKFYVHENLCVHSIYGGEIYQIFKQIKADEDLDTFNLLKERNSENKEILKNFTRDDFAEIYLFFDYDGHSIIADDSKLVELLDYFNEETHKGKLYISYPMVESLKHIANFDDFKSSCIKCKEKVGYKNIVSVEALKYLIDFTNYDEEIWKTLISTHLKKMNYICLNDYSLPEKLFNQLDIFSNQFKSYIEPSNTVSILSSYPVFIHDYYGNKNTLVKIS